MNSVTLGVDNPELCQNICQVLSEIIDFWGVAQLLRFMWQLTRCHLSILSFSGGSSVRCHHLDPRVLSYLPSQVSDQIENDIGKSIFLSARSNNQNASSWHLKIFLLKQKVRYCFRTFSEDNSVNWDFSPQLRHLLLDWKRHRVCWLRLGVGFAICVKWL